MDERLNPPVHTLIVGAGPTGLGAAWRLDCVGEDNWLLMEAEDDVGGLARSFVDERGFTWDLGGHVHYSHYPLFDRLMDSLLQPRDWLHHERASWVWICGRFVPYPFQLNLHHLPPPARDECLAGLERVRVPTAPAPTDFGHWLDAVFGKGISRLFMRPYNTKVWARPVERMSWQWFGDRIAPVDIDRVRANVRLGRDDVSWGPNRRFRYPRHGRMGAVWKALVARIEPHHSHRIQCRKSLAHLDTAAQVAVCDDGQAIRYERLLSTIPLDELVRLSDLSSGLAALAAELEYTSTHIVGVGLKGQPGRSVAGKYWMYFPEETIPFYRVTQPSLFSPCNVPNATRQWSIQPEVSESSFAPVDVEHIVDDTIDALVASGVVSTHAHLEHTWYTRLEHGYQFPPYAVTAYL